MPFDLETMAKLARALEKVGAAGDPAVVALRAAVASEKPADIQRAQELLMVMNAGHRNAALAIVMDNKPR
jgi:hypothetical protein